MFSIGFFSSASAARNRALPVKIVKSSELAMAVLCEEPLKKSAACLSVSKAIPLCAFKHRNVTIN